MSTPFRPIEIPPGVVSTATKKMRSSNWSEVNLMRWVEGQLAPVGGQAQYNYAFPFATRCRAIHSWYALNGVHHIAYLCEQNVYVDVGGVLTDITPIDGMTSPPVPGIGGYSDGLYSEGTYSTERPGGSGPLPFDVLPNAWTLDNFGQVLLAMTSVDGRLLQWDPSGGGTGVAPAHMTQVPSANTGTGFAPSGRLFVVTQERFVVIFGMINDGTSGGSFRRFGWCDQENPSAWNFSDVTSQAGFLDIEPASPIVSAQAMKTGIVFWTAHKTYLSNFLGIPYVYDYHELGNNTTPWSPESVIVTSSMLVWMSQQGPFSFDGTSILPIQCKVRSWVDDDIDLVNVREQACAVHVATFNEFWWFFPQNGRPHNTRCIIYNYRDGWWSQGTMSRSAGIAASFTSETIMADGFIAFQHERPDAVSYGNAALPFAETFDLNLTNGSRLITVKQMMPDVEGAIENLRYSLFYRNSRSKGAPELQSPQQPVRLDGYVDFRTTGRDIRLRIDISAPPIMAVTVGQHMIDAVARGDR